MAIVCRALTAILSLLKAAVGAAVRSAVWEAVAAAVAAKAVHTAIPTITDINRLDSDRRTMIDQAGDNGLLISGDMAVFTPACNKYLLHMLFQVTNSFQW